MQIPRVLLIAATVLLADPPLGRACTTDPDCNDGSVCNGTEVCVAGSCQPGTPLPNGASCADGNGCNGAETCQAGTCYPGYPQNCGNIPNFAAWCDPLTGCNYQLSTAFVGCDATCGLP